MALLPTCSLPIIMPGNVGRVQTLAIASLRKKPYQTAYDLITETGASQTSMYRALRTLEGRGMTTRFRGSNPAIWHMAHHLPPYLYPCAHYHPTPEIAWEVCKNHSNGPGCPTCAMMWPTKDHAAACCRAPRPKKSKSSARGRWVR